MGKKFLPGQSGNPAGRPKGTGNEVTELLKSNSVELMQKAIDEAKAGDKQLLAKLIDKIAPTLASNKNENKDITFESFLMMMKDEQADN